MFVKIFVVVLHQILCRSRVYIDIWTGWIMRCKFALNWVELDRRSGGMDHEN
jgi:hypothetical protein